MKKLLGFLAAAVALLVAPLAYATEYTTSTIATTFGDTLSDIVNAIIDVVVSFMTNNLPVIVVLGVSIAFVFMFIGWVRRAGHGG